MPKWLLTRRPLAGLTTILSGCALTQMTGCALDELLNTFIVAFGNLLINSFIGSIFGGTGF
ncbi:MAG: hypothetical protein HOP29_08880 [Phycisphaerales bacterium]|nr:hypothetical protein [Phycisphaerales bacterium]